MDGRQVARKRKFDSWFWKYNDGEIIKEDGSSYAEELQIYNAVLVHKDNYLLKQILDAFRDLNSPIDKEAADL